jgi:hypothetical protein
MSLVREVTERSGSSSTAPPAAPTPSQAGFPKVQHRSQRISQFKRSRAESSKVPVGGTYPTAPPVVRSSVEAEPDQAPGSRDTKGVLRDCQNENEARVQNMSRSERERELEELHSIISPEILAMLRNRAEKRLEGSTPSASSNAPEHRGGETQASASEVGAIRIEGRSEIEKGESPIVKADSPPDHAEPVNSGELCFSHLYKGSKTESTIASVNVETKIRVRFAEDPIPLPASTEDKEELVDQLSPSYIHKNYFPNQAANPASLDWLQPSQTGQTSSSSLTRFDLSGRPLTDEQSESLDSHTGLHHHGDESSKAGYNIDEIIQLCASTFLPQRTMMLGVLGKILAGTERYSETIKTEMSTKKFKKRAIDVVAGVLCSAERNSGVLREAITALFETIPSRLKLTIQGNGFFDDEVLQDSKMAEGIAQWGKLLPIPAISEKISTLLDQPLSFTVLSPTSVFQVVGVLFAISYVSIEAANELAVLVSKTVRNYVGRLDWPRNSQTTGLTEHDHAFNISLLVIRLLRSCTTASRTATKDLLNLGAYDTLMKFLYLSPWSHPRESASNSGWVVGALVIDTLEKVARYGLNGSLLSSTSTIWVTLGTWISQHTIEREANTLPAEVVYTIEAYLNLLTVWLVSAKDPHSLETEHDLVWSQTAGYGWADEAQQVLRLLWPVEKKDLPRSHWRALTSALNVLVAWVDGCTLNAPRSGMIEREAVRSAVLPLEINVYVEGVLNDTQKLFSSSQEEHIHERLRVGSRVIALTNVLKIPLQTEKETSYIERALAKIGSYRANKMQSLNRSSKLSQSLNTLSFQLLEQAKASATHWFVDSALQTIQSAQPGEENGAMRLVDRVLDLDWDTDLINAIGHKHGLYILRPFLHYTILPNLDRLTSPLFPLSNMLRATTSVRASNKKNASDDGLPINPGWIYSTLEQYLRRESSPVFRGLPPAWDATRLQMVRATLTLDHLIRFCGTRHYQDRSLTLLNAMKVFLLESVPDTDGSDEMFRDPTVQRLLAELVAPTSSSGDGSICRIDEIAASIVPPGTTFFQIYSDFVDLYDAMSLSDLTFGQLLLIPLSQAYPEDYRRLVWSEKSSVLKALRIRVDQVLLEKGSINSYYEPADRDPDMLFAYLQALAKRWVTKESQPFLYSIAIHHLRAASHVKDDDVTHVKLFEDIRRELSPDIRAEISSSV